MYTLDYARLLIVRLDYYFVMKRLLLAVMVTLGAAFFLANSFHLTEHSHKPLQK
jgi:hypothetical protein